jgi:hypothetical protein
MKAVIDDFEQRVKEVRGYLRMLKAIEWPNAAIHATTKPSHRTVPIEDEWRKVAKATGYLLIYNIVESAIRSAFAHLYEVIASEGRTLHEVDVVILDLWIDTEHKKISRESATPESYRKKASEMVAAVLANQIVRLDAAHLPVAGNLDARKIRELCELHGVPHNAHKAARGGADLKTVKDQRNALAHGHRSFAECGRDITIDDLVRIAREAEIFVRSILRNMDGFISHRQYVGQGRTAGKIAELAESATNA